jgi:hypothetical protein
MAAHEDHADFSIPPPSFGAPAARPGSDEGPFLTAGAAPPMTEPVWDRFLPDGADRAGLEQPRRWRGVVLSGLAVVATVSVVAAVATSWPDARAGHAAPAGTAPHQVAVAASPAASASAVPSASPDPAAPSPEATPTKALAATQGGGQKSGNSRGFSVPPPKHITPPAVTKPKPKHCPPIIYQNGAPIAGGCPR